MTAPTPTTTERERQPEPRRVRLESGAVVRVRVAKVDHTCGACVRTVHAGQRFTADGRHASTQCQTGTRGTACKWKRAAS